MSNIISSEPNDTKKKRTFRNKRVVVVVVLALAVIACVFAVYYYIDTVQREKNEQIKAEITGQTKETYLDNGLQVDEKLEYGTLIKKERPDDAADYYRDVVNSATTDQDKRTSCQEYFKVASYYEQYEQAVEAAECLVEVSPDFETFYIAATAHERTGNIKKQIEYLQKMYDSLDLRDNTRKATADSLKAQISELEKEQ